jgi:hypothetical protein
MGEALPTALREGTMAHDEDLFIFWTESKSGISGWKEYMKLFDTWMDPRWKATVTEVRDLRTHLGRIRQEGVGGLPPHGERLLGAAVDAPGECGRPRLALRAGE